MQNTLSTEIYVHRNVTSYSEENDIFIVRIRLKGGKKKQEVIIKKNNELVNLPWL